MSGLEKFLTAIVGIALVTTLILPKRQTPAVLNAAGSSLSAVLKASMGS